MLREIYVKSDGEKLYFYSICATVRVREYA